MIPASAPCNITPFQGVLYSVKKGFCGVVWFRHTILTTPFTNESFVFAGASFTSSSGVTINLHFFCILKILHNKKMSICCQVFRLILKKKKKINFLLLDYDPSNIKIYKNIDQKKCRNSVMVWPKLAGAVSNIFIGKHNSARGGGG